MNTPQESAVWSPRWFDMAKWIVMGSVESDAEDTMTDMEALDVELRHIEVGKVLLAYSMDTLGGIRDNVQRTPAQETERLLTWADKVLEAAR